MVNVTEVLLTLVAVDCDVPAETVELLLGGCTVFVEDAELELVALVADVDNAAPWLVDDCEVLDARVVDRLTTEDCALVVLDDAPALITGMDGIALEQLVKLGPLADELSDSKAELVLGTKLVLELDPVIAQVDSVLIKSVFEPLNPIDELAVDTMRVVELKVLVGGF